MIWKHNAFSHDVVILSQPKLPEAWNPANVRLEVVTEFQVDQDPVLRSSPYRVVGQPELRDDVVIDFGKMAMIMGKAFKVSGEDAFELGGIAEQGSSVVKEWHTTNEGKRFLIESVSWPEAAAVLNTLPISKQVNNVIHGTRNTALAALQPASNKRERQPVLVATLDYKPSGFLMDFVIIPDEGTPTTLASRETYYIRTSYYTGSAVTVQPGTVFKYKNNAYMLFFTVPFHSLQAG